jgi:hypothetical protein
MITLGLEHVGNAHEDTWRQMTLPCDTKIFIVNSKIGHGFIACIQDGHVTTAWRGQVQSVRSSYYEPCSGHLHFPAHFDCMHVANLNSVVRYCFRRSFKTTTSNSEQTDSPDAMQRTFCPRMRRDFICSVRRTTTPTARFISQATTCVLVGLFIGFIIFRADILKFIHDPKIKNTFALQPK